MRSAAELMRAFADRTGLRSAAAPRRYLWTDAFAVCNFLGLARETGQGEYLELALALVDQVHQVLGRYAEPGRGWLSGLDDAQAALHPTRAGLRIGKPLPERRIDEPFDSELEWDRDGQYFHYLTRWMHALDQVARATRQRQFNQWALELADTAFDRFVLDRRMVWKMSVDLTRPLVASMGQHDPLEGYVTLVQLRASAALLGGAREDRGQRALEGFTRMLDPRGWRTDDPLGVGGLLIDAFRLEQSAPKDALVDTLLTEALAGVQTALARGALDRGVDHRLGFRELGLAIGLRAAELLARQRTSRVARALSELVGVAESIERTWLDPVSRRSALWREHLDINEVMLATALAPDGFLVLREPD